MADRGPRLPGTAWRDVVEVREGPPRALRDRVAEEVPVEVRFDDAPFAVMMLSPTDLEDFGHGFALTERGLAMADVLSVTVQAVLEGMLLDVRTRHPPSDPAPERALPGRSGCGVCGSRRLEDLVKRPPRLPEPAPIAPDALDRALLALDRQQPVNAATGAVHAAAWCDASGSLLLAREDVGRHNALDKLIGAMQRQGMPAADGFALVTSRASYEMVAKAAAAGIGALAAMSAPTALAVDLAQACGMQLVAFARPGRHVRYAGPGPG